METEGVGGGRGVCSRVSVGEGIIGVYLFPPGYLMEGNMVNYITVGLCKTGGGMEGSSAARASPRKDNMLYLHLKGGKMVIKRYQ